MDEAAKIRQLRKYKWLATGMFLFMLIIYCTAVWITHHHAYSWTGYVTAFSEAAMVGALADWFAVTALFHHPLGIPVPHTNLIEKGKQRIGSNLGNFVVDNFLTAPVIRPYIARLTVSGHLMKWLGAERNRILLVSEISALLHKVLRQSDSKAIARFAAAKGADLLKELPLHSLAANGLQYLADQGMQHDLVAALAGHIREYIRENESLVRDKVKQESYFFIPSFIDRKLAGKITSGLQSYLDEIITDKGHRVYAEVDMQLSKLIDQLHTDPALKEKLQQIGSAILPPDKIEAYAEAAWNGLRQTLEQELGQERSATRKYLGRMVDDLTRSLQHDERLRERIDLWARQNAYKYILRYAKTIGSLISNTVGNWEGRELSRKLELEVGTDLQFIRINGTLVGGLLGLIIYTLTQLAG